GVPPPPQVAGARHVPPQLTVCPQLLITLPHWMFVHGMLSGCGKQHTLSLHTDGPWQLPQLTVWPQLLITVPHLLWHVLICGSCLHPHTFGTRPPHVSGDVHWASLAHSTHSPPPSQTRPSWSHTVSAGSNGCLGFPPSHRSWVQGLSSTG